MNYPIYCTFNEDSGFVELRAKDGSMIAVNCSALEDELDLSRNQRTDLDWLIYNQPLEYIRMVLSGELESYLRGPLEHGLED